MERFAANAPGRPPFGRILIGTVLIERRIARRKGVSHRTLCDSRTAAAATAARSTLHIDAETAPESAGLMARQRRPSADLDVLQRVLVAVAAVDGRRVVRHRCGSRRHALVIAAAQHTADGRVAAGAARRCAGNLADALRLLVLVLVRLLVLRLRLVQLLVQLGRRVLTRQIQPGIVAAGVQRRHGRVQIV